MKLVPAAFLAAAAAAPLVAQAPTHPPVADSSWNRVETRADAESRAASVQARMDADHDGYVTAAELATFLSARSGETPTPGSTPLLTAVGRGMLDDADTNHDGRISVAEAKAASGRGFDEADTNHDGKVTPEERAAVIAKVSGVGKSGR